MYQGRGLTEAAQEFLDENVVRVEGDKCPRCDEVLNTKMSSNIYEEVDAFYGCGPRLLEYDLDDGRIAREVVQAMPWSSGPVCFKCLEIDGEKCFEWSQEEIDKA